MLAKATTTEFYEKHFIPGVYFHGELEDIVGYDLVCSDEKEILNEILSIEETLVKPVEVLLDKDTMDAMLFAWKGKQNGWTKGLIVSINDKGSVEFATKNMKIRPDAI